MIKLIDHILLLDWRLDCNVTALWDQYEHFSSLFHLLKDEVNVHGICKIDPTTIFTDQCLTTWVLANGVSSDIEPK